MTESTIVVCTSNDPEGGAGTSAQKLVMYLYTGIYISPLRMILSSCVRYSRNTTRYGYAERMQIHLGIWASMFYEDDLTLTEMVHEL